MFGVRSFEAVINSPQAAILAVGEIAERPQYAMARSSRHYGDHLSSITASLRRRRRRVLRRSLAARRAPGLAL